MLCVGWITLKMYGRASDLLSQWTWGLLYCLVPSGFLVRPALSLFCSLVWSCCGSHGLQCGQDEIIVFWRWSLSLDLWLLLVLSVASTLQHLINKLSGWEWVEPSGWPGEEFKRALGILSVDRIVFLRIFPGGFPRGSDGKKPTCNAEDLGSIPGSGRSPREGNGNPLQYSCLSWFHI